ncbi:ATP-binding protein [Piscinibacter sp.]|uniref:ATP-binding protein n=1 Tax=Piscinibacter sp. TaxID=1903157 RepID=UPI003559B1D3
MPPASAVTEPTPDKPLPADPELARLVAGEQLRMVFAHSTMGSVIATVFALFLASHLRPQVPITELAIWVALKIAVVLPRIALAYIYRIKGGPSGTGWQRWTVGLLALDGACWGLGGAWLMGGSTEIVPVVAASLSCVASVATFGLQVRLAATAAYVVPMIGPTALALLARRDEFGLFAGVGLMLFLGLMLVTAQRSQKRLAEVFTLRFLTDRISAERAQALALAKRESAVKSQFLATMSHEFRTPLHGILGLTRLIRTEQADPKVQHRLGLIEHSGEHLLRLINDLLDVSRIEAGRVDIRPVRFELNAELDELADVYLVRCDEKGLEFVTRIELPLPCWAHGDATRLRQVLHNLLGNALKFTERGSVELQVGRRSDGAMEFRVQDSGAGIAAADLSHLFEAFWQASGSAGTRAAGSGLGLNIAREITRAMGGDIRCETELGRGSQFVLWLPLPEEAPPDELEAGRDATLSQRSAVARAQVLLAEDNDVNALLIQAILERHGCAVTRVVNGVDAVHHAVTDGQRPDVVLMDSQMPVMDGLEAARRIRVLELSQGLARVPIVALTANTADDDRLRCELAGMDQFVGKPFTEDELLLALGACLPPAPAPLRPGP